MSIFEGYGFAYNAAPVMLAVVLLLTTASRERFLDYAEKKMKKHLGISIKKFNDTQKKVITYTNSLPPDAKEALVMQEEHYRKHYNIKTFTDE